MATHSSILTWRIAVDRGAWWAAVHGVSKSQTWLSNSAHILPFKKVPNYLAYHTRPVCLRLIVFELEENCFTILCCFCHITWISHNSVCVCARVCIPSLSSLPTNSQSQSHPSVPSRSSIALTLCYTAASHQLSIYGNIHVHATFSVHPSLSFPRCVHKYILYMTHF